MAESVTPQRACRHAAHIRKEKINKKEGEQKQRERTSSRKEKLLYPDPSLLRCLSKRVYSVLLQKENRIGSGK